MKKYVKQLIKRTMFILIMFTLLSLGFIAIENLLEPAIYTSQLNGGAEALINIGMVKVIKNIIFVLLSLFSGTLLYKPLYNINKLKKGEKYE